MRDLKLRGRSGLTLAGERRRPRRRIYGLTPFFVILVAIGGLYGAFGMGQYNPSVEQEPILALPKPPLIQPSAEPGGLTASLQQGPATSLPGPLGDNASEAAKTITPRNADHAINGPAIDAKAATPDHQWLQHEVQSGDSLARIFKRLGLSPALPQKIVRSGEPASRLRHIKPGQLIRVRRDSDDRFAELEYEIDPIKKLVVEQTQGKLTSRLHERSVSTRRGRVNGVIESSLFESAQRAGLSDAMTMELAKIFGWDIDFALEIRSGDRYSVLLEERWLDGEKLKGGKILAAEFINQGKTHRAVLFKDSSGHEGYYSPDGHGMRKAFLRTPVKFSHISSGFSKRRWHPVLKKWRSHKGVDYAAPTGTPVKSAGSGKVTFVGRKGGYGKVIFIQHQGKYTTVYGHLSRYAKGIKRGRRVKQDQLIGYVGQTGLASGPHLHYEFRVDGKHRNPLKVTLPPAAPIAKKYLAQFKQASAPLLAELDGIEHTLVATNR